MSSIVDWLPTQKSKLSSKQLKKIHKNFPNFSNFCWSFILIDCVPDVISGKRKKTGGGQVLSNGLIKNHHPVECMPLFFRGEQVTYTLVAVTDM